MAETPIRYGFPLFTKNKSTDYIVKNKHIRVSDIWAFWTYAIRMHKKKHTGVDLDFMLSLIEQAQYFYTAAMTAPIKSQPLLYYYSFLNLAKIVINMDSFKGIDVKYVHGISNKILENTTLSNAEIKIDDGDAARNKYSIAFEFMKIMGDSFPDAFFPLPLMVKNVLKSCIGIHRTYCETYNEAESFYRLLDSKLYRNGMALKWESMVKNCDNATKIALDANGYTIDTRVEDGKSVHYQALTYAMTHYTPSRNDFYQLSQQSLSIGLWSYDDGNENRLYISNNSCRFSTASIIYLLMFFFGSITRYHPYMFDKLISDKEQWLVSEFLKNQPEQFLRYVTSRTIGANLLYR